VSCCANTSCWNGPNRAGPPNEGQPHERPSFACQRLLARSTRDEPAGAKTLSAIVQVASEHLGAALACSLVIRSPYQTDLATFKSACSLLSGAGACRGGSPSKRATSTDIGRPGRIKYDTGGWLGNIVHARHRVAPAAGCIVVWPAKTSAVTASGVDTLGPAAGPDATRVAASRQSRPRYPAIVARSLLPPLLPLMMMMMMSMSDTQVDGEANTVRCRPAGRQSALGERRQIGSDRGEPFWLARRTPAGRAKTMR
jgi:hypothetical protein